SLIAEVSMEYFELIANDNALVILRQAVLRSEEALEAIKMQKETGRANLLALQQFAAQLANARSLETEATMRGIELENRLNLLLGRYPQAILRKNEVLYAELSSSIHAGVPSTLLQNRPDVREAEFQVQASQFDLKSARAAFFPNLHITAGVGFQAFQPD